jgi:hypothetical protein
MNWEGFEMKRSWPKRGTIPELEERKRSVNLLATCFILVSSLAYSSTLKMDATFLFEISLNFQETTRRHIPAIGIFITTDVRTANTTTWVRIDSALAEIRFPHKRRERYRYANLLGLFRVLVYRSQ